MTETRVALVTGANRGIGLETAAALARRGVLTVIGSRSVERGQAAVQSLEREGLTLPVVALDVTDEASVRAAVAETLGLFQRIDILINNAGVMLDGVASGAGTIATMTPQVMAATFDVNLHGPLRMLKAVLPIMRDQSYGRIVNVSSSLGQLAEMGAGHPAYRMSKTAQNALTRTAAAEIGQGPIKINAVCPGWVKTDMGGPDAPRSIAEGAETIVWAACLPEDGPTGGFFRDKAPIAW